MRSLNWRNKLEANGKFASVKQFNKDAAWEQIHERLCKASRIIKRHMVLAGSGLSILALMVPWLFIANKKENVLVKNNQAQKQIPSSTKFLPLHNKSTDIVIATLPVEKKPFLQFNKRANKAIPAGIVKTT